MFWNGWYFFGMHFWWWAFWLVGIILFVRLVRPMPREPRRSILGENALELLRRRYARGDLTTAEYEERRDVLTRDLHLAGGRGTSKVTWARRTPEPPPPAPPAAH